MEHMRCAEDDLESILLLSLGEHVMRRQGEAANGGGGGGGNVDGSARSGEGLSESGAEGAAMAASSEEFLKQQQSLLDKVKEESEKEFIDKAITNSLCEESRVTEDDLLEAARVASLRDVGGAMELGIADGGDADYQRAIELSNLSEEEAFQLALRQSVQASGGSGGEGFGLNAQTQNAADDELQRALQLSISTSGGNSAGGGGGGGGEWGDAMMLDDDDDENLKKALAESMKQIP